jgi:hypothetical protein
MQKYIDYALAYGTTTFIFHHHLMYMLERTMSAAGKYVTFANPVHIAYPSKDRTQVIQYIVQHSRHS